MTDHEEFRKIKKTLEIGMTEGTLNFSRLLGKLTAVDKFDK